MGTRNYDSVSDKELLARMRENNDPVAFRFLYERHWEKLYLIACRKVKDDPAAADIVQEIFVRLWENKAKAEIHKSLDGYLFISLRNAIFNYYKNKLLQLRHLNRYNSQIVTEENTTEILWSYKELYGDLTREVALLPEKMQKIFLLSRKYNLSTKEIAEDLSISEQTVRNQISDALRRIRRGIGAKK